jgi:hypothetical protein
MSLLCKLAGHAPQPDPVWNCGYSFSRCTRCGRDIIHSGEQWSLVPSGHKVVWKQGFHEHSIPADYRRSLPVLQVTRGQDGQPLHLWHRQLLLLASDPAARGRDLARSDGEEDDEPDFPTLFWLAMSAGMTVDLLQRPHPARDLN